LFEQPPIDFGERKERARSLDGGCFCNFGKREIMRERDSWRF